ncbi:MAG: hypothetical protein U9M94_02615 [Patescibacteria group bacterium]|nr:hypothetical protein [Patescibacteria group bacterium]
MASLLDNGVLSKIGKPPKVFYLLKEKIKQKENIIELDKYIRNDISERYLIITPAGGRKVGFASSNLIC